MEHALYTKRPKEMTADELVSSIDELDKRLAEVGRKFNETDDNSYTIIDDCFYNTKQMLGDEIYGLYAAYGTIRHELEKR